MKKRYVVELTKDERESLEGLISSGTAPARMLNRARILLKADVGEHSGGETFSDDAIAGMLETSTATVGRVRTRFWRQGLERRRLSARRRRGSTRGPWTGGPRRG